MSARILVSLRVSAAPDHAFRVFTREIGLWWQPNGLFRFTGGPPGRLAFTWRQASFAPSQQTRVEVRFERLGEETRVTVEHHGWESVPLEHVARHGFPDAVFMRRHGEWWQALLAGYRRRLS